MGCKTAISCLRFFLGFSALVAAFGSVEGMTAFAGDLPLISKSPAAGVTFEDRPFQLPIQDNFKTALTTASGELGRTCGKMEAYGWKLASTDQGRVNDIFNNTADRLRGLGYDVESQSLPSVSQDITTYTADRTGKHFLFMWSAGEVGLVMTLCETSGPAAMRASEEEASIPPRTSNNLSKFDMAASITSRKLGPANFSPAGRWVGDYICAQGYTGVTVDIDHYHNQHFDGVFHFYPTAKNPYIPEGIYSIYGQYDPDSERVLINPGKWVKQPNGYMNTVMIGSFDPIRRTLSVYFQGINGCTSLEAKYTGGGEKEAPKPVKKKAKKKKIRHKKIKHPVKVPKNTTAVLPNDTTGFPTEMPKAAVTTPETPGIKLDNGGAQPATPSPAVPTFSDGAPPPPPPSTSPAGMGNR